MQPHALIAALIAATKKSTLQVAAEMDKPSFQGTLHKFAHGLVPTPSHKTARKIADYFQLPIEAIYDKAVAARIARERGVNAWTGPASAPHQPQQLELQEPGPQPYRIGSKPSRALNSVLIERIGRLDAAQLATVEGLITSYLDAVAPVKHSKAASA